MCRLDPKEILMRKIYVPAIAAACLFALPALAATDTTSASSKTATPDVTQIQQDLHQDLTKAGYTDIQIVPGSFLVRAKDKNGNQTEMMISPHSMTEVTEMNPSGASTPTGTSTGPASDTPTSKVINPSGASTPTGRSTGPASDTPTSK
jgi:hypothetical protein